MENVLSVHHLSKSYETISVLSNLSFALSRGEKCHLQGTNGSGKTTLLRSLSLLEPFQSGSIQIGNSFFSPSSTPKDKNRLLQTGVLGYVFQELEPWPHLSAIENIALPLRSSKKFSPYEARSHAIDYLEMFQLQEKGDALARTLSGGQKRRLLIARMFAMDPKILFLDEIFANLDRGSVQIVSEIIQEQAASKTVLMTSHTNCIPGSWFDSSIELGGTVVPVTTFPTSPARWRRSAPT